MKYDYYASTDRGLTRENNEDSVALDPQCGIALLADGMGGYNAGEVASGMATTFIKSELARWLSQARDNASSSDFLRAIDICIANANRAILNAAVSNPQYSGMGTTLVLGIFRPRRLVLAHIGDSRCYLLRQGRLSQLTRDHSLLQDQIDAGLISAQEAAEATHKNLVTRALGVEDYVSPDMVELVVEPGDVYLMCSDGLSDLLDAEQLCAILSGPVTLAQRGQQLIAAANARGGTDNIAVLLAQADNSRTPGRGWFARWRAK